MNETFSKGNYECTVTEAYKTISSDFFYTLVDEQYHEALAKEIAKPNYISKDTGKLIDEKNSFFCVKIHLKYTGSQPTNMSFYTTGFSKRTDNLIYASGFLFFIDKMYFPSPKHLASGCVLKRTSCQLNLVIINKCTQYFVTFLHG